MKRTLGSAAIMLLGLSLPLGAQQESSQDGRWLPFVGCWEAVGAEEEIGLLCLRPAEGGVELTNFINGELASSELLVADGQQRSVSAESCDGWEQVDFSEDGRRVFTTTEFQCEDGDVRSGSGVMTILSTTRWADVRALDMDGEPVAWVQEYALAGSDVLAEYEIENPASDLGMVVRTARMAASAAIDLDDVMEAASLMDAKAVETWVVLQGDDLDADAGDLMALADAGVSDAVIDAVVAVSNPETFMVEVGGDIAEYDAPAYPVHYRGYMTMASYWGPRWGGRYGYGYAPYSPWYGAGYGYGGYGYGYWGYRPGYIVVRPRGTRGGSVVPGRGYTRPGSGTAGRSARPRGGTPAAGQSGASSRRPAAQPRRAKRRPSGSSSSSITTVTQPTRGAVSRRSAPAATSRPSAPTARPSARPTARPRPGAAQPRTTRPARASAPRSSGPSRVTRPARAPRASAPRSAPSRRPAASRPSGSRAPAASRPRATARPSGARPARSSRPSGRRSGRS